MAKVPPQAVEFARLLVRAFYPPEYVILTDAVLRLNNYVSHQALSTRLRIQPKELRQILAAMAQNRLMKCEKRQQKRIDLRDERRPNRMISTEFWYVPLGEIVDSFVYRVHILTSKVQNRRNNELEQTKYVCNRCNSEYQLIDIVSQIAPNGADFQCLKIGAWHHRPSMPCHGIIAERDNSGIVKEMERLQKLLDQQLRALRERAQECQMLDIPAHPLEGADEETWGERVPETVGLHGEAVDEEGMKMQSEKKQSLKPLSRTDVVDDTPIPEKPSWFKEGRQEEEDEWDEGDQQVFQSTTGTAAVFGEEAAQEYYKTYQQDFGIEQQPRKEPESGVKDAVAAEVTVRGDEKEEQVEKEEEEDVFVTVLGKQVKLSDVTDEMQEQMSADEYKAYYSLANQTAGGDDDDDDEFE